MTKSLIKKTMIAILLLTTPAAHAVLLTFDENAFAHGTVVDNEYAAFGVNISATNIGGGPNLAVAFDTAHSNTSDTDLLNPFSGPLSQNYDPDNILIIQENSTGCQNSDGSYGTCSDPDDEGSRPAGKLTFNFASVVEILSLDFFDIENNTANSNHENSGQVGSEIRFFDDLGNELFAGSYFAPGTGGDNTWDRLFFQGVTGVSKLEVNLAGSGAIDNLEYNVVPLPTTFWLFGSALLGFIGISRRTSI